MVATSQDHEEYEAYLKNWRICERGIPPLHFSTWFHTFGRAKLEEEE